MSKVSPTYIKLDDPEILKKIDPDALRIIKRINKHNFRAYLVGGCVRDLLLKKEPKDFDIVTEAWPRKVRSLFKHSRIIGRRFQLVHVLFGDKFIEVSTFRQEDKTPPEITRDGSIRKYENRYGNERTDAFRRDLTINALFLDPLQGLIIDYVGGYKDLLERKIRVIGNPVTRFQEDPVRMLRAVRHGFRTGFQIMPDVREAIRICKSLIKMASPARLFDELRKDVSYGRFSEFLQLLNEFGLLEQLFPLLKERLDKINSDFLDKLSSFDLNKAPELFMAVFWFAVFQPREKMSIPAVSVVEEQIKELFGNCSPPKSFIGKAVFLITLFKRVLKGYSQGKHSINLKAVPDTLTALENLIELVAPSMLDYFRSRCEDIRNNTRKNRQSKAQIETAN